jgi:hypothetical protein
MRVQVLQHWVLGFVVVATVLWLGLIPGNLLWRIGLFTLAWAAASTVLVGSFGAWIALARTLRQEQGR